MISPAPTRSAESPWSLSTALARLQNLESLNLPDVVVPIRDLAWTTKGSLLIPSFGEAHPNDWALQQLGGLLGIRFGKWFETASSQERSEEMSRRLRRATGKVRLRLAQAKESPVLRAVVTPSYSPILDTLVLGVIEDALNGTDARVHRLDVTDRMTSATICVGEPQTVGGLVGSTWGSITATNSSVGWSSLTVSVSLLRLVCSNGMRAPIAAAEILRVRHRTLDIHSVRNQLVGGIRSLPGNLVEANQVLTSSTTWKVDNVEAEARARLREAGMVRKHLDSVMAAYRHEPHPSVFGLSQAITMHAQQTSPEDRVALEQLAGGYVLRSAP